LPRVQRARGERGRPREEVALEEVEAELEASLEVLLRLDLLGQELRRAAAELPRELLNALRMDDADFEKLSEELEERRAAIEVVATAGAS
jgi:hypothetical protein